MKQEGFTYLPNQHIVTCGIKTECMARTAEVSQLEIQNLKIPIEIDKVPTGKCVVRFFLSPNTLFQTFYQFQQDFQRYKTGPEFIQQMEPYNSF